MPTVITATPVLDKTSYNAGDLIRVAAPDMKAVATAVAAGKVGMTFVADDGTTYALQSTTPVQVTSTKTLGVKFQSVTWTNALGQVTQGTVAADGLSASVPAS